MFRVCSARLHALASIGACLLVVTLMGPPAQAGVADYGVMWSFIGPDDNNSHEQSTGIYGSLGFMNDVIYMNSWQHSNTWPPSSTGGRGFFAGGVDRYGQLTGNYAWLHPQMPPNDVAGSGQMYGYGTLAIADGGGGTTDIFMTGFYQNGDINWETGVVDGGGGNNPVAALFKDIESAGGAGVPTFRDAQRWADAAQTIQIGGSTRASAAAIGAGVAAGTYYSAGRTAYSLELGTIPNPGTEGTNLDPFILQYDAAGNVTRGVILNWDGLDDSSANNIDAMVVDPATGDLFVAGYTPVDLKGDGFGGDYDMFVAKFDSSLNQQWLVEPGQTANRDFPYGQLTLDGSGNVYVGGLVDGKPALVKLSTTDGSTQWLSTPANTGTSFRPYIDSDGDVWLPMNSADDLADVGGVVSIGDDMYLVEHDAATGAVISIHQIGSDAVGYGVSNDKAQTVYSELGGQIMFITGDTTAEWRDLTRAEVFAASGTTPHDAAAMAALKYTVGDLNNDRYVDWNDMQVIVTALAGGDLPGDPTYDFNGDGNSTGADVDYFMQDIFESEFGDFNWNGVIDQGDYDLLMGWQPGDTPLPLPPEWRGYAGPATPTLIDMEEWLYLNAPAGEVIPEPSTFALLGLGLVGLGLVARRRRRK